MRKDQQRKGYTKEAAIAVRDWAFRNTPFHTIYSYMKDTNEAMLFQEKNEVTGRYYMNKEWSQKNKEIQILLGKKFTYKEGIQKLILFREELFGQISNIVRNYPE